MERRHNCAELGCHPVCESTSDFYGRTVSNDGPRLHSIAPLLCEPAYFDLYQDHEQGILSAKAFRVIFLNYLLHPPLILFPANEIPHIFKLMLHVFTKCLNHFQRSPSTGKPG